MPIWMQIIPVITSLLLAVLGIITFVVNIIYSDKNNKKNSLIRKREAIRSYSISFIEVYENYSKLEIEYLRERFKINQDKINGIEIKSGRSNYVYQLKSELKTKESELKTKVWNSNIEISRFEFKDTQDLIFKSFKRIRVITKNLNIDVMDISSLMEITVLETSLKNELEKLTRHFIRIQDNLTKEIMKI